MRRKVDPYWAEQLGVSSEPREIEQWRCGCDRCNYRVDFWDRDQAEEAARAHNSRHGGKPEAQVYVASSWSLVVDFFTDASDDYTDTSDD